MIYAERDEKGEITAITSTPVDKNQVPISDAELIEFITRSGHTESYQMALQLLDSRVIRVLEDLVDLLIKKNVIMFTELPEEAREKITERKRIRRRLSDSNDLTVEDIL